MCLGLRFKDEGSLPRSSFSSAQDFGEWGFGDGIVVHSIYFLAVAASSTSNQSRGVDAIL